MKRRLLFLFAVFMVATSVGWGQNSSQDFIVNGGRADPDTDTNFKTLEAAVEAANKLSEAGAITITVKAGTYDLKPGTVMYEGQSGWYLPIAKKRLTIKGEEGVTITSTTFAANAAWASQNLVTIFGDNVTLENLSFVCKTEVNKIVEVVGDNVTLRNIKVTPPEDEYFAGSIYFNSLSSDSDKDLGVVTLENIDLTKGRLSFTGVNKGTVNMRNVTIAYEGVKMKDTSASDLQVFSPISSIASKTDLKFPNADVTVKVGVADDYYALDAATVANLPEGTKLVLSSGDYTFKTPLSITKPITIQGAENSPSLPHITGTIKVLAADGARVNLKGLHLSAASASACAIEAGTDKGNEATDISITDCTIDNADIGLRMMGAGSKLSLRNTDIDCGHYGISMRNSKQSVNIVGGTLTGWAGLMTSAGGLTTGDGSVDNVETSIEATDVVFNSRTYAIGVGNSYAAVVFQEKYNGITAKFTGCTFEPMQGKDEKLNTLQAAAVDFRSYNNKITFSNCKLYSKDGLNYYQVSPEKGTEGYVNAAVIRLGWHGDNAAINSKLQTNTITITDSELEGKAGEQLVYSYRLKDEKAYDVLTINGVGYTPESGLICYVGVDGTVAGDASKSNRYRGPDLQPRINNAVANEQISLRGATYKLSSPLKITEPIVLKGAGIDKTIIEGAVAISISESISNKLVKISDVTFDYTPALIKTGRCIPVVGLKEGKTDLIVENCIINNRTAGYGSGYGTGAYNKMYNVFQSDSLATGTMTITGVEINLLANNQRAVSAQGQMTAITLKDCQIKGNLETGNQQHGLCLHRDGVQTIVDNTTIQLSNHYGIWLIGAKKHNVTIKNKSNISGFGAVYLMNVDDCDIHIESESVLTGITRNNGPSDSFGALILEGANACDIMIEDSYIGNRFKTEQTAEMTPILINSNIDNFPASENNKITILGKSLVRTLRNESNPFMVDYGSDPNPLTHKNFVSVEGDAVQFKDQDDKDCILIYNTDGTFRNAAVSLIYAVNYGSIYEKKYYHWPIANTGDIVKSDMMTGNEVMQALNAAVDFFFKKPEEADAWEPYVIPDNVSFSCKDGFLITGETAAKVYAIANPYKRVYWLNQGEESFSIKDYAVAIEIKNDTTWATPYSERKVNVLDGATLTLSTPMVLDTVTMEEGAQLRSALTDVNQKVTAKVLRFAPKLSGNNWKALGVPFTSLEVKDSKGASVSAPSAQEADNGIWFADLKNNKTPIFEVKTDNFGAAGLWAANGDTYTISSEGAFEFKTLEEPAAPTETGTFLMCSNPNTFTITLKQSAYILTADGTSFEQEANPEIKPFQSFVLTDTKTLSTLRSLRIGDGVVTGTQGIEPVDGYYVTTDRGAIVIHTPEPMDVVIIGMNGKVAYRSEVTDGQRIMVPSGIYAVNGQLVRVK